MFRKVTSLILIAVFVISMSGCASTFQEMNRNIARVQTTKQALVERPNLTGYSQQQFLDKYCNPNSTSTAYSEGAKIDTWIYGEGATGRYMVVTFKNGIVTKVDYH